MSAAECTGRRRRNRRATSRGVPQEYGLNATAFVDAGSVFRYSGPMTFPGSTRSLQLANANTVRSSVGAGLTWALAVRRADGRLRRAADESGLRHGAAVSLQRRRVLGCQSSLLGIGNAGPPRT